MNPYEGLQDLVARVPELVQPFIVALAGAVPYIEGEGAAALGVIAGINPVVAGISGAAGNIICVVLVVLLSARVRTAAVARRARRTAAATVTAPAAVTAPADTTADGASAVATADGAADRDQEQEEDGTSRKAKGRQRLRRWMVRFGVPGASLLGPLALPTQLTAATLVASGVSKSWVILWQVIAIVLWTTLLTAAAAGFVTVLPA